ncbi:acyloxyacyl hydrolase [Desulfosarcina sp.]|uniref:acyloxyacyl hydrolase n=1 Tax=Desulfosarcina sp. TaxID=2027861 RepID=UPI003970AF6B
MKIVNLTLCILIYLIWPIAALSESRRPDSIINEIRIGIMEHDVATRSTKHEDGNDFTSEFFFRSPGIRFLEVLGSPRPSIGFSVNNNSNTNMMYAGLNWDLRAFELLFLSVGLGGAFHDGELQSSDPERQRLGSRALFRAALAAGFKFNKRGNVSVLFDHVSNGHMAYPNNGLEKLGLQFGFTY